MKNPERMANGLIYDPGDEKIMTEQVKCLERLYDFNATRPQELEKRTAMLKEMFGSMGENCYIEPPLRANWGGKNVYVGSNFYANFNLTLVDDGDIYIGDKVLIGPNVTIATANHPVNPELRAKSWQYNKPVHIGSNVWIGAGSVLVPGVSVGDNTVIGAGSVVVKDIPANCVAVGNPCKPIREIGEHDREFFYKNEKIDWNELDI